MRHVEDFCNRRDALELYEDCKAAGYARITAVNSRTEEITAPALYNLTGLQKDANRYHNLTAIRVQEITQSLYEKKLISCPRTSSRLLPGDVYDMLPPVMEKLLSGKEFRQYAGMIDLAARKGVTGNQDTAEHHAIVITGIQPGNWTGRKGWFTPLLSAGCLKRSCRPARWNIRRLKRSVPHASSESVHTVFWKRGGSVSFRGNGLSRKTTTSVPYP